MDVWLRLSCFSFELLVVFCETPILEYKVFNKPNCTETFEWIEKFPIQRLDCFQLCKNNEGCLVVTVENGNCAIYPPDWIAEVTSVHGLEMDHLRVRFLIDCSQITHNIAYLKYMYVFNILVDNTNEYTWWPASLWCGIKSRIYILTYMRLHKHA